MAADTTQCLEVQLSGVDGFYAPWSPSIRTSEIKVLTADSGHKVVAAENSNQVPPRLGGVSEFRLHLRQRLSIDRDWNPRITGSGGDEVAPDVDEAPAAEINRNFRKSEDDTASQLAGFQRSVARLTRSVWVVASILVLMLFFG